MMVVESLCTDGNHERYVVVASEKGVTSDAFEELETAASMDIAVKWAALNGSSNPKLDMRKTKLYLDKDDKPITTVNDPSELSNATSVGVRFRIHSG
jgi:hypothetical protein